MTQSSKYVVRDEGEKAVWDSRLVLKVKLRHACSVPIPLYDWLPSVNKLSFHLLFVHPLKWYSEICTALGPLKAKLIIRDNKLSDFWGKNKRSVMTFPLNPLSAVNSFWSTKPPFGDPTWSTFIYRQRSIPSILFGFVLTNFKEEKVNST